MALTGIEIFKMLPKTNCKECGFPTCLAFAMALASGKAELDKCPYVSDEAKEKLAAASAPPIRPVKLAMKEGVKTIGGETVMFRHEKTFFNPTIIAGLVTTAAADAEVDKKLDQFMKLQYDRVGLLLRPEMIVVHDANGDAGKFAALAKKVMDKTDAAILLCSDKADVLKAGAEAVKDRKPTAGCRHRRPMPTPWAPWPRRWGWPWWPRPRAMTPWRRSPPNSPAWASKTWLSIPAARALKQALQDQIVIRRAPLTAQVQAFRLPHHHRPGPNDRRSHDGKALRRGLHRQIRRHRGGQRPVRRRDLPPAAGAPQHLHRPAEAHDHHPGHLRDRHPG